MDYSVEFYKQLNRQGPGDDSYSLTALDIVKDKLPSNAKLLDLGCGTGAQSLLMARNTNYDITSVDVIQDLLDVLAEKAKAENFEDRIHPICANIASLPFKDQSFDIIWSECALYTVGLKSTLSDLSSLLKPGGIMVFTDLVWTQLNIPNEIFGFWTKAYPEIDFISYKMGTLDQAHLMPLGFFQLPKKAWTDNYFKLLQDRKKSFLEEFAEDYDSRGIIRAIDGEYATYQKYGDYYNYAFFISQKSLIDTEDQSPSSIEPAMGYNAQWPK